MYPKNIKIKRTSPSHLNEPNNQDLEENDDPRPGPSCKSSCVDVETPIEHKRSFESIVSAPERAGALENGWTLVLMRFLKGPSQVKFSLPSLMGFSRDKKATDGGVVTPLDSSFTRYVQFHANNQDSYRVIL
ncbi:unnamed protein product [Orchesella dallaii]|uniref:Uncharacterized protein n=1 Tax=Orchesella dallaii TaxID=48710 RepID=A0ABP1S0Z3_9HEXA